MGLANIKALCGVYDTGHTYIAFNLATEVRRVLVETEGAVRLRGTLRFRTPYAEGQDETLTSMNKLVVANMSNPPPRVSFVPAFEASGNPLIFVDFKEWWNRDVIYRASCARPGTPPNMIPLRPAEQLPFAKRETCTRRELVDILRNKLGAHISSELPELLDDLQAARSFGGDFSCNGPNGEMLSTHDGTLVIETAPLPAMMRQIAHETIEAFAERG